METNFKGGIDMGTMKGRRNRIKHFLIDTVNSLFKPGMSKHKIFQECREKEKPILSPYIHSYPTKIRYEKVMAAFGDFLSNEMGIKYERDFRKLSVDEVAVCLDKYFEKEIEKGRAQNTLEIHISALNKILSTINPELQQCFNPENRAKWRDGAPVGDNDRYNNPQAIIENLKKIDETAYHIAEIQRLSGCRIGDVKKLEIDEEGMRAVIKGSKGGRDRNVYYKHFHSEFEKLKEHKQALDKILEDKKFSEIRENDYYNALRKACRGAGEPYRGSHPFRYEAVQYRHDVIKDLPKEEQEAYYLQILKDRGKSPKDIREAFDKVEAKNALPEAIISEELGHSRLDISRHYLKIRAK